MWVCTHRNDCRQELTAGGSRYSRSIAQQSRRPAKREHARQSSCHRLSKGRTKEGSPISARYLRLIDRPVSLLCNRRQIRIRIDRKRVLSQFQHRNIMDRIAKTRIEFARKDLAQSGSFPFVRWDLDQLIRSDAAHRSYGRRKHALGRNAEALYPFDHYPVIGRRNRPDFASGSDQLVSQLLHLRKDSSLHYLSKELLREGNNLCYRNIAMDLHHL